MLAGSVISAPGDKKRKVDGVPADWPSRLLAAGVCDVVLVEADGARKLPFKVLLRLQLHGCVTASHSLPCRVTQRTARPATSERGLL
jgi:hypothetical protein